MIYPRIQMSNLECIRPTVLMQFKTLHFLKYFGTLETEVRGELRRHFPTQNLVQINADTSIAMKTI